MTTPIAFYYNFSLAFSGLLISAKGRSVGFTASVPLNEGVRELVAWWQAERAEQAMRRLAEPRAEVL
ncbi:MAG: hypothetical protein H0U97_02755 [Gammaproteobacteria bacterium]|nr:hypothetical protein [Gammaproteobacteria bacterium]